MPCPKRNMSAVIHSAGEDGEHVPVDMELTCTIPQDGTLTEQVTVSIWTFHIRSPDPFTLAGITISILECLCWEKKQSWTICLKI